ncbi:ankyrin repeat-containing domain protein [Achaetomium macrosporum]|uniref:Ankyrin repeat-containing domain protein n=1 Tax=Achaetomium macrosporum TaxID=79813 RepID=A0AAN7C1H4_9PEZI|nr:ankyrin repeat-containing domain protein [Achaetomium macrosporum]
MDSGETSKRSEDEADAASGLRQAAIAGDKTLVRKLLGQNQDTTAQSSDASGRALLRIAVEHARLPIIPILLDHGADIETLDSSGRTALHQAVGCNDVTLSKLLLNWGANPHADREVPLYQAVMNGDVEVVKLLLQHGADTGIPGKDGRTAQQVADQQNLKDLAALLRSGPVLEGPAIKSDKAKQRDVPLLTPPPLAPPRNNPAKIATCHVFEATIIEFYTDDDREQRYQQSATIYDLLYGRGPQGILIEERPESLRSRQADFTWYHLPANNVRVVAHSKTLENVLTLALQMEWVEVSPSSSATPKLALSRFYPEG